MAWHFDAGEIACGQTVRWAVWWGDGPHDYKGVQVIQARPLTTTTGGIEFIAPTELVVSEPSVKLELDGGYTYFVSVTNRGWSTRYELRGNEV